MNIPANAIAAADRKRGLAIANSNTRMSKRAPEAAHQ
jgi:hypothetical protein